MSATVLQELCERMSTLMTWHLAMPLIDHDGGDECDAAVEERRFLRALRKPRSRYWRHGNRLYVMQEPEPFPIIHRFNDPGDEDGAR